MFLLSKLCTNLLINVCVKTDLERKEIFSKFSTFYSHAGNLGPKLRSLGLTLYRHRFREFQNILTDRTSVKLTTVTTIRQT